MMITTSKKLSTVFTAFLFAFIFVLVAPVNVFADNDKPEEEAEEITFRFEDDALLNFFDANRQLSELNRESQERMAEAASEHDLTLERFNQIARANQIGALQGGAFTDEEVEAFINLGPKISQIQREQQQLVQNQLQELGFTSETYQEILTEYRQDADLQAHVRDLLRERRRQEILEERRRAAEEKANEEAQN
ncbi:MAG: hypothetical protein EA361_02645 [Bacteroidetes bacterium]|nr:MAG: hypothetical protein EA361_02645 [Bacteroidota bacterium]